MQGLGTLVAILRVLATELCAQGGQGVSVFFTKEKTTHMLMRAYADAEALQVTFDPSLVTYNTLLQFFYKMHDPTTKNRQGMDSGTQYRSAIFYHSPEQKEIAETVTEKAQKQWWKKGTISTEILEAGQWWDAEDYHQLYLHNNPGGYECPAHFVRKFPELE